MNESPWMRCPVLILMLAVAITACDSTPKQPEDPDGRPPRAANEDEERVVVPRQCVEQMNEYVGRKMMVLADRIVIDASSDPFFGSIVVTADPRVVEKTQAVDAKGKMTVIRLRNKSAQSLLERDLPQIRVGDGLGIIATREILIRFHNKVTSGRPVYFDLLAKGNVVFDDPTYAVTDRSDHMSMRLSITKFQEGFIFEGRVE